MPVYDYKCKEHGIFHELATIDKPDVPQACPSCGTLSPRIIMVAPTILDMSPTKRKAHITNERNQHEPTHSTHERRQLDQKHSKGCGCTENLNKSKLMYTARGEKMFPTMRPWMISH